MTLPPIEEMRAIILAAGLGKRMRDTAPDIPKPLVTVAGRTLIDRAIDMLVRAGVRHAVVNVSYMAEKIVGHLAARDDITITFSHEETPLETGGGIMKALPMLGGAPFFAINSDVICLDGPVPALHRLRTAWDDAEMDALLLVHPTFRAYGYSGRGDFILDTRGRIRRRTQREVAPFIFSGIQLLHPRLFAGAPGGAFSMNVFYTCAGGEGGWMRRIPALAHDGTWLHVGDGLGLRAAEKILA